MSDVPLITSVSSLDLLTEAGLDATAALDIDNRPFFWQQIERLRAALAICDTLAPVRLARVTLTDAQIKALPTTPITLIAAAGSGKTIVMLGGGVFANNTAGAYTNVNTTGSQLEVYYAGDSSVWVLTPIINDSTTSPAIAHLTEMLTGAGKVMSVLVPYHDSPAVISNGWVIPPTISSTTYENKAVVVAIDNGGSGNITGGNAANSLRVDVAYMVL